MSCTGADYNWRLCGDEKDPDPVLHLSAELSNKARLGCRRHTDAWRFRQILEDGGFPETGIAVYYPLKP